MYVCMGGWMDVHDMARAWYVCVRARVSFVILGGKSSKDSFIPGLSQSTTTAPD